jgi:hypothetical protein
MLNDTPKNLLHNEFDLVNQCRLVCDFKTLKGSKLYS